MSKSLYNNTSNTLTSNGSYTGGAEATQLFVELLVSIKTDRNTTVYVDQSADKINWDVSTSFLYTASEAKNFHVGVVHQWFRVRLVNLINLPQSYLRMTTYKKEEYSSSVSVGTDGTGVKRNILVDSDGKLSVSLTGTVGPQGKSAYQVALDEGFVGSESAWLASLVGPAGATGATGATGAQGVAGVAGVDGVDGAEGQRGLPGINGSNGIDIRVKGTLTTAQIIALPEVNLLVNDAYFSSDEFKLYVFSGVQWVASESLRGPAGAVGSVGPAGVAGSDGASVLVLGTLASAALLPLNAMVGHAYFLSDTFQLAVSRGPTLWTFSGSLRGATGATGATGQTGLTGEVGAGVVARGSVADETALNAIINMSVGDLYIVEADYKMYIWNGTLWRNSGVSMRGPQGEIGLTGPQGTVGSVGARGYSIVVMGNIPSSGDLPTGYNGDDIGKTWFVNDTYTMVVWDGTTFQSSAPIRGPIGQPGIQGEVGETGYSIVVLGQVSDAAELAIVSAGFGFTDTGKTYVKLDTYSYEIWNGTAFVSSGNLRGAPGADGLDGEDGLNAINLQVLGSVADAAALAAVSAGWTNQQINQAYFQDDNFTLNIWNGMAFVSSGSLRGEQGVQGIQGETGATGPTGATGEIGPQGPAGVMPAPTIVSYEVSSGTGGGTGTAATWNVRPLNSIYNSGGNGGVGLSANKIVFTTAGTYKVEFTGAVFDAGLHQSRLRNITTSTTVAIGMSGHCSNANDGHSEGTRVITVAANDEVELQHFVSTSSANNLGDPVTSGEVELYARVVIERLS